MSDCNAMCMRSCSWTWSVYLAVSNDNLLSRFQRDRRCLRTYCSGGMIMITKEFQIHLCVSEFIHAVKV